MPPTLTWLEKFDGACPTFELICEHTIVGRCPERLCLAIRETLPEFHYFQVRAGTTCYLGLADNAMCRTHFAIRRVMNEHGAACYFIRDLGSRCGIRVNRVRNNGGMEMLLQGGQTIDAGGSQLVFNLS